MFTFALVLLAVWIVGFVSLLIYLKRRKPSPTERRVVIVAALLGMCPGFLGVPSLLSALFITRMDEGYLLPLFVIGVVVGCPLGAVTAAWTAIAILGLAERTQSGRARTAPRRPLKTALTLVGVAAVGAALTFGILSYRASTVPAMLARHDVDGLLRKMQTGGTDKRVAAIRALGQCGDKKAVPALIAALNSTGWENASVRREAAEALGNLGDPEAVPALIDALTRPHTPGMETDPEAVLQALGKLHDPRVVPALIEALKDHRGLARIVAAQTLGQLRDPRAIEPVRALTNDEVPEVRDAAVRALQANGW